VNASRTMLARARGTRRVPSAVWTESRRLIKASPLLLVVSCSWFTDFKRQPKIDPWESGSDTIPFRGNPQSSVPIYGSEAPGFIYDRAPTPQAVTAMASLKNPVPADSASVNRGRIQFQINCAPCHGPAGLGNGPVVKYGLFPPAIGAAANPAAGYTDGYIFGIIRNGRGLMPTYNRIEEADRWDIVNYIRSLQGKLAIAADTSHGRPGETGALVPGASTMGPTRPAPYHHPGTAAAAGPINGAPADSARKPASDSTKKPETEP
jgi:mono/diheme cytochrome c family protein